LVDEPDTTGTILYMIQQSPEEKEESTDNAKSDKLLTKEKSANIKK